MAYQIVRIATPLLASGQYQLWDSVDTPHGKGSGKKPRASTCDGPDFLESFTFDIGNSYEARNRLQEYVGTLTYRDYGHGHHGKMTQAFFQAVDDVMTEAGFPGTTTVLAKAERRGKTAWKFSVTGVNYRVHKNFILAKLMGKEQFEPQIWEMVARREFPNLFEGK